MFIEHEGLSCVPLKKKGYASLKMKTLWFDSIENPEVPSPHFEDEEKVRRRACQCIITGYGEEPLGWVVVILDGVVQSGVIILGVDRNFCRLISLSRSLSHCAKLTFFQYLLYIQELSAVIFN